MIVSLTTVQLGALYRTGAPNPRGGAPNTRGTWASRTTLKAECDGKAYKNMGTALLSFSLNKEIKKKVFYAIQIIDFTNFFRSLHNLKDDLLTMQ